MTRRARQPAPPPAERLDPALLRLIEALAEADARADYAAAQQKAAAHKAA